MKLSKPPAVMPALRLYILFFQRGTLLQPVEITAADDMPVQIPYQPQTAPLIPVTLGERRKTILDLSTSHPYTFVTFSAIMKRGEW
jgi:hypothetical protein